MKLLQVIRILKGNEGILGSGRRKFQKRPAFKRTCSADFSMMEDGNTSAPLNDLSPQNKLRLEL